MVSWRVMVGLSWVSPFAAGMLMAGDAEPDGAAPTMPPGRTGEVTDSGLEGVVAGAVTGFCPIAGGGANLGMGTAGAIPAAGDRIGGRAARGRGAAFGGELLPLCAAMTPCRTMIVLPSLVL